MPGTPTESPDETASANAYGWPVAGSMNAVVGMAAGAVSRPSIVVTSPVAASKYTKYPPPPIPALYGSVTPSAAAVATAASAALPPLRSTWRPMALASASTDDTAPP